MTWFAVRCIFEQYQQVDGRADGAAPHIYEERITVWQGSSQQDAIEKAEAEAVEYALVIGEEPDVYVGLAQSFEIGDDAVTNGTEIFSLLRESDLAQETDIDTFFDAGREKEHLI